MMDRVTQRWVITGGCGLAGLIMAAVFIFCATSYKRRRKVLDHVTERRPSEMPDTRVTRPSPWVGRSRDTETSQSEIWTETGIQGLGYHRLSMGRGVSATGNSNTVTVANEQRRGDGAADTRRVSAFSGLDIPMEPLRIPRPKFSWKPPDTGRRPRTVLSTL